MGRSIRVTWAEAIDRNVLLRAQHTLADIRTRVVSGEDGEAAVRARAGGRTLSDATDAVVRLHSRDADGSCRGCSRRWHRRRWPCPTLRALSRAVDTAGVTQ